MSKAFREALEAIGEMRKQAYKDELARVKADAVAAANEATWALEGEILKADEDKRQVFGWASIVEKGGNIETDGEDDQILPEHIEEGIYSFALKSRQAGDRHERVGVGKLIESIVFTKEKQEAIVGSLKAQGIEAEMDLKSVGAWVGFQIEDEDVWKEIKAGKLKSFSIGGRGRREAA